ncbi:MAG: aspartate-semialdehyde dehydrogenase [Candidatus Omnitrophota bacterium]
MKKYNVAIVGIRGVVGQSMLETLKQRSFPYNKLKLISTSCEKDFTDENGNLIEKIREDIFEDVQIGLFSPGASVSKIWAPIAAKSGCVVIDNTSQFRMDADVPLVVPEVNPLDIAKHHGIIANPNCSTIQMVVALKPLHDFARIKRIVVSTYQAVSGAGGDAITELESQMMVDALRLMKKYKIDAGVVSKLESELGSELKVSKFPHQILANLIPQIDVTMPNLYTKEEMKMVNETKKIMGDDNIKVTATCVRCPVFYGHSESVNIETENKISREKAVELLSAAPGVTVLDDLSNNVYPTPVFADGKDDTFVGRIREDETIKNGLNLWIVADNIRKGAALNAIQIAEEMIRQGLI